jgi:hypothetical protein
MILIVFQSNLGLKIYLKNIFLFFKFIFNIIMLNLNFLKNIFEIHK